jgi:hypothetical protein
MSHQYPAKSSDSDRIRIRHRDLDIRWESKLGLVDRFFDILFQIRWFETALNSNLSRSRMDMKKEKHQEIFCYIKREIHSKAFCWSFGYYDWIKISKQQQKNTSWFNFNAPKIGNSNMSSGAKSSYERVSYPIESHKKPPATFLDLNVNY